MELSTLDTSESFSTGKEEKELNKAELRAILIRLIYHEGLSLGLSSGVDMPLPIPLEHILGFFARYHYIDNLDLVKEEIASLIFKGLISAVPTDEGIYVQVSDEVYFAYFKD